LHDLRHGAATLAHAAGADLKPVQEQLGHTSMVLTADTYASMLMILHFKVAEAIARLVLAAAANNDGSRYRRRKTGPPKSAAFGTVVEVRTVATRAVPQTERPERARNHVTPKRHPKIK
jgi:hypothetical protein